VLEEPVQGQDRLLPPHAQLYERIALIRRVEERLIHEYGSRRLRMPLHLSIGQEAAAVGVLYASRARDTVVGTHRSHAIYLAKGGGLQAMIDELYSLPTGCSGGLGGSMHLSDPGAGLLGSTAVLGGGVPISVGSALAHRWAGEGNIAFAFTGDGGVDEGSFWESLNLAALLRLPVLFAVENNGYSTLTAQHSRQASVDIVAKCRAFGVESLSADGNDVVSLAATAADLVSRLRGGEGPFVLELRTFRQVAHVGVVADWGAGRPLGEYQQWPSCDPLVRFEQSTALSGAQLSAVRAGVDRQVDAAFAGAIAAFEALNAVMQLPAPPPPSPSRA